MSSLEFEKTGVSMIKLIRLLADEDIFSTEERLSVISLIREKFESLVTYLEVYHEESLQNEA